MLDRREERLLDIVEGGCVRLQTRLVHGIQHRERLLRVLSRRRVRGGATSTHTHLGIHVSVEKRVVGEQVGCLLLPLHPLPDLLGKVGSLLARRRVEQLEDLPLRERGGLGALQVRHDDAAHLHVVLRGGELQQTEENGRVGRQQFAVEHCLQDISTAGKEPFSWDESDGKEELIIIMIIIIISPHTLY